MAKQHTRKTKKRAAAKRAKALTLTRRVVGALPESAGQLPIVRRAFELLEGGEQRAAELGEAGRDEIDLAIARVQAEIEERIDEIETETEKRAQRFVRRVRASPFGRRVSAVPRQLTDGLDLVLDRLGLIRKSRHQKLLDRMKQRLKAPATKRRSKSAVAAAGQVA
jgi:hypothetical protein